MRRPAGVAVLLALALAGALASPVVASASGAPAPTIELSTRVLAPGATVALTGTGWPQSTVLHAVLCGAAAIDGSVDCVEQAAVTMTPGPDGALEGSMPVVAPPKPCPCIMLITDLSSTYSNRIPVEVAGVPNAPVASISPATRPLTVRVEAHLSGGTSVSSFFGGAARRTAIVRVTNTGPAPITPVVVARFGRGSAPRRVARSPRPVVLAPGETHTFRLPVRLDPFSFGTYNVAGAVAGGAKSVPFESSTSTWPWGLLVVAQVALLAVRNAVRRHLWRQEARARRRARRDARDAAWRGMRRSRQMSIR